MIRCSCLKLLVLKKYYGLSDDQTEFQIKDRFSFIQFLGLQAGDSVSDAKTIWDFKQLLEKDGRGGARKLFVSVTRLLEQQGMIAREGSTVDASFVDAPRQCNSRGENTQIKAGESPEGSEPQAAKGCQKDCDARWVKKMMKPTTDTRTMPRWTQKASWLWTMRALRLMCITQRYLSNSSISKTKRYLLTALTCQYNREHLLYKTVRILFCSKPVGDIPSMRAIR